MMWFTRLLAAFILIWIRGSVSAPTSSSVIPSASETLALLSSPSSIAPPFPSHVDSSSSHQVDDDDDARALRGELHRLCWTACDDSFIERLSGGASGGADSLLAMIDADFSLDNHTHYCRVYHEARECANLCASTPEDRRFLTPFYKRHAIDEVACVRHFEDFRRSLPCYQHGRHSLEFFFSKCSHYLLMNRPQPVANRETCVALSCVDRYLTQIVRQECTESEDVVNTATRLMASLVEAFLRQQRHIRRLRHQCAEIATRL